MSEPTLDGFSQLQIKFVESYLKSGNATQAVFDAGYKTKNENTAAAQGSTLLRNPKISAYIQHHQNKSLEQTKQKIQIDLDKITSTLARIAFDGLDDIVEVSEQGSLEIKPGAKLDLVDGVSWSESESDGEKGSSRSKGFSFKRSDRLKALDMLVKLMGGYEQFEHGTGGESKKLAPERVLKALAKFRK